ncbi:zinc transporter 6 [Echinococcus multilocularis]|uniref:Zinc transporter 6 n=1 Tax=Echinococcus multilocularis TaxID=6211 RepID=A0A068Y753_ECHMU|nr:zinc transporter 6 [Echinococcus multilocularis]
MGLKLVSAISSIYSGILSDFKYCKKFVVDLVREVAHLAKDSKQASQILKLACCIFVGLVVVRVLTYLSNSIALSAFSDLILFDVLFLLVALVSIWVRQQTTDVKTYCFGYDRFEVIAVFASTILSILSSFYLLKEAIERLFEPVVVAVEYMPWASLICLGLHVISIYSIDNPAFAHVTQACVSSWLQEQVADISRSMRSHVPALFRALPPRMNPIALVGSMIVVVILITYVMVDPTTETGTFPDTIAAVVISLLLFNTMFPMAVYSGKILLQTTPSYLVTALDKALREASTLEGVLELRNEHFWTIGFGALVGSLYVRVRRDASDQLVLAHVTKRLHPFVKHLTVQVIKDDWARPAASSNFDWPQPMGHPQSATILQVPTGCVH